ncbi:hypothetical protein L8C07_06220 [Paenibacillus sp. CMAA1739]|uniref:hypothetical protein n=1 Tax=Paenibacillus ottowii TaxID=2315729 RepID=UPI002DB93929|nr:hypothetical protein [Paenibacillus sp. CMAA1739]MEC4565536.1 hypothetical protein [Paenibacillus sp. CMAA1739]
MSNVIFGVNKEMVGMYMDQVLEKNDDSLMVLAPPSGTISTYAPSKKGKNKGYYRVKLEVWIPEDSIEGEDALNDFGASILMRLPKNRIADHLK